MEKIILIVEDDKVSADLLVRCLSRFIEKTAKVKILCASNIKDAEEKFKGNIDSLIAIFLDGNIPVDNSEKAEFSTTVELSKYFRDNFPGGVIIAMSGSAETQELLKANCDFGYSKPIYPDNIRDIMVKLQKFI